MNARVTPGATPHHRPPSHAVSLDLRRTPPGGDAVRAALDTPQPGGDERRFVVVDDADRLVAHQFLYEQLYSYGPARIVCLAVGSPEDRVLRRPLTLRPPAAGVLWLLDPLTAGDPDGLRPLVELLAQPEVFDAALRALGDIVHGVAVPSVRVVEHDLTDEARTRAWKQALDALAGQEAPGAGPGDAAPSELAVLLDDSLPDAVHGHTWLDPARPAAARRRACDEALEDARAGHRRVRGPAGLLAGATRTADLPGRLDDLGRALESYRDTVAGAFTDADGVRLTPEQRARLLERGIVLPDLPAASRARVVPALRDLTERLPRPAPPAAVGGRPARLPCPTAPPRRAARPASPGWTRSATRRTCATWRGRPASTPAAAARPPPSPREARHSRPGCGPAPAGTSAPAVGLAAGALGALMRWRRPNRSPDGGRDGGATTRWPPGWPGGLAGGAAGAAAGALLGPPAWAGAPLVLLALVAAVVPRRTGLDAVGGRVVAPHGRRVRLTRRRRGRPAAGRDRRA